MAKDYKKKKGATGKRYTTVGDVIKVTYTDGSTRVVRPSDKTYAATKSAMEKDIGAKKWYKPAGNSKTTAETAVGKGVTDGVVTSAKKVQQNQQYSNTMKQRRAQEAQQKAVAEVAKRDGYNTKPVQKVDNTKKNNNLADALAYGAKTGANTAISGIKSGVIGAARTAADVVGADNLENNLAHQLRLASAKQQLEQQRIASQYNTNFGGAARVASDVTAGAVGMLPTIGSFVLTPQGKIAAAGKAAQLGAKAIGFAPLALQSYGGGQNQALNEGATINQANAYGAGTMAKELGTEILFGGIPYVPGIGNIGKAAANMVKGETAKKVASAAGKMAGEGIEEAVATAADPFLQRATYNEDAETASGKDIAYSALVGGLTAGALNTGIKGVETGVKVLPTPAKVIQNNQNRAFEALHGQKMMENQAQNVQKPQVKPQQAQDGSASKYLPRPEKPAQNQNMKADFQQNAGKNIQKQKPVQNEPKKTLEMSERTFENVGDKNVRAYQQENPAVKPFYQRVADNLLADLQEGIKGGRDAGVDPETRTVTTMGGWQREQNEPIERMLRDGMTYNQIEDGLQRIVEDHGKENTANAKRAELYIDDAVRNGYRSVVEGDVSADRSFAYRGMTAEQLQEVYNRLENSFTGNPETDAGIISEMETVQNLLDGMQQKQGTVRNSRTVAENTTVDEEFSEAGESDRYQELIDNYGAMPKGENPFGSNRDIEVPNQTNDFDKVRRFNRTAMEAEQTADETVGIMKDKIASDYQDGSVTYEPISNKATLNDANIRINQNGWESEANDFSSAVSKGTRITAEDIAVAERCIQEAQKAGNYEAAANIISDLSIVGTEYGQAIQALSMLKRLSPEGQLKTFLKVQERINNQLIAQGKKPVMDITPEVQAEFLAAKDIAERDAIWNREIAKAASQTSGTWREKINALRYAAMLSNPKTHIRNIIGNFVMQAAYVPRNLISGGLQDIKGGEKTHSFVGTFKNKTGNTRKELREFANHDYHKEAEQVLRNIGNRYDDVSGQFASQQKVFGDNFVGRGLEQVAGKGKYSVGSVLDAEDMAFKQLTYQNALIGYMKANGISVQDAINGVQKPNGASIAKGREYAVEQARKATFTEDNIVAEWLSEGERKLGVGGAIAIGSVMPFKKTPLNILSRGVEFSPVGAGMTAYKLYHAFSGKKGLNGSYYDMNDVMDSIGANLTGVGIMKLGMYLASEGLLVATGDDEEDRKAIYDQQMGDQNFAVVNPLTGESWTIDWLAPSAMPLLTGVEVYRQLFGNNDDVDGNTLNKALESASKIADPVFEMSCMQGVASALASYSGDAGDIASSLMSNVATGIAGQFIPQPIAAIARTIDDTVRSSYAPKDSDVILGKTMESFLRQQRSKVPGMSQQNEPSIDVWGNERKREFAGDEMEQVLARTFNNFFNPTTYSSNKRTELDLTLEALYKSTGDSGVLPKSATNYVTVDGTNYHKTPEEKTAYDRTKGQKSKQYVSDFVNSSAYANLDNTTKTNIVEELYNLANYEAKKEMLGNRDIDYSDSQYENVLDSGVSPHEYYATKQRFGGKFDQYNHAVKYAGYADQMQMKDEKFVEVYDSLGDLHADKDKNGKTKSGSRRKKVETYLDEERSAGRITKEQYWYFLTKEYPSEAKNAPYAWIREANKQ